jgi:Ca2+-binding RTX toxin-like protein
MGYRSFGLTPRSAPLWSIAAAILTMSALVAATPAQGATVKYPSGGSDFATDAQGWTGADASCTGTGGGTLLCQASSEYDAAVGNPPGSIAMRVNVTANARGLFAGAGTWVSPPFTATAGQEVNGATFQYDRRFDPGDLVNLAPTSTVVVRLVDESAGSTTTLLTEDVASSTTFAPRGARVAAGTFVAGHRYRLRIETSTTSTTAAVGVLGQASTHFDNVALAVNQGAPIVSPGVTIAGNPLSNAEINVLFKRFDETTEVGRGPGGSLVPLAECTIVGTPGRDRIKGTTGNDVICGLGGNDVVNGAGGIDIIDGARGADRLTGAGAKDKLIGLAGKDRENGGSGRDQLGGGAGRDRLAGGKGGDRMHGGSGRDRLSARDRARDRVDGGRGRDQAKVDRLGRRAGRRVRGLRSVDRVRQVERLR